MTKWLAIAKKAHNPVLGSPGTPMPLVPIGANSFERDLTAPNGTIGTEAILSSSRAIAPRDRGRTSIPVSKWTPGDWREYYEEKAAVLEYDGELPKDEAEAQAWECCVVKWLNKNPEPSAPEHCMWCGKPGGGRAVVPFGIRDHTWLHPDCWHPWHQRRIKRAKVALRSIGVGPVEMGVIDKLERASTPAGRIYHAPI
jgi:hypothetical protein